MAITEEEFQKALEAADGGDVEAQLQVAELYKEGQGCKKSIDKWLKYLKKAESNGSTKALEILLAHYEARGDKAGYVNALKSGRKNGIAKACITLADYYANGKKGVAVDLQTAHNIISEVKGRGTKITDDKELEIVNLIEARYEKINTRNKLILLSKIFAGLFLLDGFIAFNWLIAIILISPLVAGFIIWFGKYGQKANNLIAAKIIIGILGVISTLYIVLFAFVFLAKS